MYLVSACLLGENCRYDGKNNGETEYFDQLKELDCKSLIIRVCPECDGGMTTPRKPSQIEFGFDGIDVVKKKAKVTDIENCDVTCHFLKGANIALERAQKNNIRVAILKESSPSCGSSLIYNGKFNGKKKKGMGVTSSLLNQNNIKVFNEKQVMDAIKFYEKL